MRRVRWMTLVAVVTAVLVGLSGTPAVAASHTRITTQPVSRTVATGAAVSFTVHASGSRLSYQWQRKAPGGSWKKVAGAAAHKAKYTLRAKTALTGYRFRALVKGTTGAATSKAVTLRVVTKPTVTRAPKSRTADAGDRVTFSAVVSGGGLSYRWQRQAPGGAWTKLGATTARLVVTAKRSLNGYRYRLVAANKAGRVTTKAAVLSVRKPSGVAVYGGYDCPAGYPIKGNADSGIYHVPGGEYYSRTKPEECFSTEAAARAAGYRRSLR